MQGNYAKHFFSSLDPLHIPPHRLAFMRIVRLLDRAILREYKLITNDNFLLYGSNFVSTNSDFYTNSERRESCGCLVGNQLAKRYVFHDGRKLFMSTKTFKSMGKETVLLPDNEIHDLEVVLAFNRFADLKTAKNIADWLTISHDKAGIKPGYISSHSTDGASNAVGSAAHFKAVTAYMRETDIQHFTCFAHQVNRSARFASGTGDFVMSQNENLAFVLRKLHDINSRIYRNEKRLQVLYDVQQQRNRKNVRKPYKGVVTRWNSEYKEVRHTNMYMGDLQMALSEMLDSETGIDKHLLKDASGDPVDRNALMFVPNELSILRQYECAAEPVMRLSHFFQTSVPTVHQVLVTLRARIKEMREPTFLMYGDISYSDQTILADQKKIDIVGSDAEKEQHGATVQPMLEEIYDFRSLLQMIWSCVLD